MFSYISVLYAPAYRRRSRYLMLIMVGVLIVMPLLASAQRERDSTVPKRGKAEAVKEEKTSKKNARKKKGSESKEMETAPPVAAQEVSTPEVATTPGGPPGEVSIDVGNVAGQALSTRVELLSMENHPTVVLDLDDTVLMPRRN